jgi:ABC-type transporter MlaC component
VNIAWAEASGYRGGLLRLMLKLWIFLSVCFPTAHSLAVERPDGDPRSLVEKSAGQIANIARTATSHEKMMAEIRDVMAHIIDYQAFSRRTLKGSWESLKKKDQKRFVEAFQGLVIHTYAKRFKIGTSFQVSYRGDTVWREPDMLKATVKSTIQGKKAAVDVDYIIEPGQSTTGRVWRVVDIVIDEVSMALNWRKQFKLILRRDGFERLLEKIQKKGRSK